MKTNTLSFRDLLQQDIRLLVRLLALNAERYEGQVHLGIATGM